MQSLPTIEVKFHTHISELKLIENDKDPPQKTFQIEEWVDVKIKKIKDKLKKR